MQKLIKTVFDFNAIIAANGQTGVAGYDFHFIMADGAPLSFAAAVECAGLIRDAIIAGRRGHYIGDEWDAVAAVVNMEDQDLVCCHTGVRIEPACGFDDDTPATGTNWRTQCGHGRASYHPEWSAERPYATYRDGVAGQHFASLEACAQYFASYGMYLNQEGA